LVNAFGIAGAGAAQAAVSGLVVMPLLVFLLNRASVPWQIVLRAILPTFFWAAATAALGWYVASLIPTPALACLAGGAASLLLYLVPYLPEVRRALASQRHRHLASRTPLAEPTT
jgi:hypothetical protein